MMPGPTTPCPLCGRMPKLHETRFKGEPPMWVLSCVGDRHSMAIFKIGSPEETIAEWDRRLGQRFSDFPPAGAARAELREWDER